MGIFERAGHGRGWAEGSTRGTGWEERQDTAFVSWCWWDTQVGGVLAVLQFGEGVRNSDLKPCGVVKCIFDIQKLRGMGLVHPVFPQTQMTKSLITTSFCDFLSLKM